VTKKEIVKVISEKMELTQLKTKEIVQRTFDAIVDTLVEETRDNLEKGTSGTVGRIELRNFGVFEVKRRAARKARNPRTGAKVFVPEKFVVTFKPGKEMEERVRQLEQQYARRHDDDTSVPSVPQAKPKAVSNATSSGPPQSTDNSVIAPTQSPTTSYNPNPGGTF